MGLGVSGGAGEIRVGHPVAPGAGCIAVVVVSVCMNGLPCSLYHD